MPTWTPDPTFYPSPRMAMRAPAEQLAYVAAFDPQRKKPDGIAVVDVDPASSTYSRIVGTVSMANAGDEFHHFGWNACSSCLCPQAPHPHVERRYLIVPGLRSSRIYILDTRPDPRSPKVVKVIEPQEVAERAGYTRPHTVHCGPEGIYVAALGNREGKGPGGVFLMDHETFDVRGQWEMDRGPQQLGPGREHHPHAVLRAGRRAAPTPVHHQVARERLRSGYPRAAHHGTWARGRRPAPRRPARRRTGRFGPP